MVELVERFFMVIGGIATVVALYKLYRGRLKLRAKGAVSELRMSRKEVSEVREFLESLRDLARDESFDDKVQTRRLATLKEKWPAGLLHIFRDNQFHWRFVWTFEITNVGKAEVRDLILELPFEGIQETGDAEAVDFSRRISLGTLRSKGTLRLTVWTDEYASSILVADKMYLTHAHGSVPVSMGRTVYGRTGALAEVLQEHPIFSLVAIGWVAFYVMYLTLLVLAQTKPQQNGSDPSSTPTTPNSAATYQRE